MALPPDRRAYSAAESGQQTQDAWMAAMRAGDFEAAWRVSDAVLHHHRSSPPQSVDLPLHLRSVWDGAELAGRQVLVRCYHGLGDALQFLRLVTPLARLASDVMIEAPAELLPLLASLRGPSKLVALGADPGPFEVEIEAQELPHALRLQSAALPGQVPYLAADPARAAVWRAGLEARPMLNVGLVWTAGAWHPARSIPLRELRDLACFSGVRLHSLQQGPARAEVPQLPGLVDSALDQVEELAALLCALDLIITVDTFVSHLAGALGRPTWTLLHEPADWRWMVGRNDTPWYPTMRLFRQQRPGEWGPVVGALTRALESASLAHRRGQGL